MIVVFGVVHIITLLCSSCSQHARISNYFLMCISFNCFAEPIIRHFSFLAPFARLLPLLSLDQQHYPHHLLSPSSSQHQQKSQISARTLSQATRVDPNHGPTLVPHSSKHVLHVGQTAFPAQFPIPIGLSFLLRVTFSSLSLSLFPATHQHTRLRVC
jgi:hypothetical protein